MTPEGRARTTTQSAAAKENLVFKALANETRRMILMMLHDRGKASMTSKEIAEWFDMEWQAISRHLSVLSEAGLVTLQVRGRLHEYGLVAGQVRRVAGRWIDQLSQTGPSSPEDKIVFPTLADN
jgi:DNA-binding transcriptional ArsR family regulator